MYKVKSTRYDRDEERIYILRSPEEIMESFLEEVEINNAKENKETLDYLIWSNLCQIRNIFGLEESGKVIDKDWKRKEKK